MDKILKEEFALLLKENELRDFIINTLHSGATIYEAIGAYNLEKRNEIITIVDNNEYQKLMNYLNHEDPEAFVTIYTVSNMRYQPKKYIYINNTVSLARYLFYIMFCFKSAS